MANLVTVVGDFDSLDGSPVSGRITFTPSVEFTRNNITYPSVGYTKLLDADGKFSVDLPATDDPAVSPQGFTYRVQYVVNTFDGTRVRSNPSDFNVSLSTAQGPIVNLATLLPAPAPGFPSVYLTRALADTLYAFKGQGGTGGGGNVDLSSYATLAALASGLSTRVPEADFIERVQDAVAALLAAGTGVTVSYDDANGKLTLTAASGTGGSTDPEVVRDTIGVALTGVGLVSVVANDIADTITISTTATANSTDAALRDRSTHTGTQAASTITGLATVATSGSYADLSSKPTIPTVSTAGVSGSYTDLTNKPTIPTVSAAGVSGSYTDLTNKPTIPAAATTASTLALIPNLLKNWARIPIDMAVGTITYNTSGAPTGHNVEWPDGATGVYAGTASSSFPGSIDTYTLTHVLSGTTTTTYTQPAVTRDSTSGQVTSRPTITVALAEENTLWES